MILLLDNYDSFVYNLKRYVQELGHECLVMRNDKISIKDIKKLNPSHIILSPGPCTPNEAGISIEVVLQFASSMPILGVCLGHQIIARAFGGLITRSTQPLHGQTSLVTHDGKGIFYKLDSPLTVARYHSLIVAKQNLPECLQVTAISEEGEIMALQHKNFPVFGVQFHPESFLTPMGYELLSNFLVSSTCFTPLVDI